MTIRALAALAVLSLAGGAALADLPEDHHALTHTMSYAETAAVLKAIDGVGTVRVTEEAKTAEGRSVFLVHAAGAGPVRVRVLIYAQQHGDEVSGKDALLYVLRDVARGKRLLPAGLDLWVMPLMNPDGAEAGTRRNAAKTDLNRDHIVLEQPETDALHRVARRVLPHVAVDCHEFGRTSDERTKRGWSSWPDITMDGVNNPLFDPAVVRAAMGWVKAVGDAVTSSGHPFLRYTVGGLPPDDEQRPSAPDLDSGLNGIGAYGGLSFIVEACARRDAPPADLVNRVDAYLVVFRTLLDLAAARGEDVALVDAARRRALPPFIPTNYLWVNPDATVTEYPVTEIATGKTLRIPTANMMTTLAVKRSVPTPAGYAIDPAAAADFRLLLERHAIPFDEVKQPAAVTAQRCTLVRLEPDFDEVYSRYEGRQIVTCDPPAAVTLPAGALRVPLVGESAVRAALLLEPQALYGVFQYARFTKYAQPGKPLPVMRLPR